MGYTILQHLVEICSSHASRFNDAGTGLFISTVNLEAPILTVMELSVGYLYERSQDLAEVPGAVVTGG